MSALASACGSPKHKPEVPVAGTHLNDKFSATIHWSYKLGKQYQDVELQHPDLSSQPVDAIVQIATGEITEYGLKVSTPRKIRGKLDQYAGICPWNLEELEKNYRVNLESCSGALVRDNLVITAAHCIKLFRSKKEAYAIFRHDSDHDKDHFYAEPHTIQCIESFVDQEYGPDLMTLRLNESISNITPLKLAQCPHGKLRPLFHPFGMRMMTSTPKFASDCTCETCRLAFSNGTGGSGGAILTSDNRLAGVIDGHGSGLDSLRSCTPPEHCMQPQCYDISTPPGKEQRFTIPSRFCNEDTGGLLRCKSAGYHRLGDLVHRLCDQKLPSTAVTDHDYEQHRMGH